MANKARGEVDLAIAGATYPVAITLDALGRLAEVLGLETLEEVEKRVVAFRIADFKPILSAVLEANGHKVPAADLARVSFRAYTTAVITMWNARPGEEAASGEAGTSPQKRAA